MHDAQLENLVKNFTNKFYAGMDKRRTELNALYAESGICHWNGHNLNGRSQIMDFINNLPLSKHECTLLDAQPIDLDVGDPDREYLVVVGGYVSFNDGQDRQFHQTFFINEMNGQLSILNDTYQLF